MMEIKSNVWNHQPDYMKIVKLSASCLDGVHGVHPPFRSIFKHLGFENDLTALYSPEIFFGIFGATKKDLPIKSNRYYSRTRNNTSNLRNPAKTQICSKRRKENITPMDSPGLVDFPLGKIGKKPSADPGSKGQFLVWKSSLKDHGWKYQATIQELTD